jgi:putative ABC transport system permease protein
MAIVAGFIGLTLLGGYIIRVQNSLKANTIYLNHLGHLSIYREDGLKKFSVKPARYQISGDLKTKIYQILQKYKSEIEFTGEALSGSGLISNGLKSVPFLATGIQPELEERIHNHPMVIKWAKDYLSQSSGSFAIEFGKNPRVISLTKRLGELIGRDVPFSLLSEKDREVQLAGRSYQNDLNAVNAEIMISHSTGLSLAEDTSLWAPISILQELYGTDGIQFLALYLRDESSLEPLKTNLGRDFAAQGLPLEIYSYDNDIVNPTYVGAMSFLRAMAGFFIFLICGAVALSIVNSLTMGILERTRELGTLRALGFEAKDISVLFSLEALILTSFCIVVGGLSSLAIAGYLNHLNIRFSPPGTASDVQFLLTPNASWIGTVSLTLILVSVITGYVASAFKLKQNVIDLLSDSGA